VPAAGARQKRRAFTSAAACVIHVSLASNAIVCMAACLLHYAALQMPKPVSSTDSAGMNATALSSAAYTLCNLEHSRKFP